MKYLVKIQNRHLLIILIMILNGASPEEIRSALNSRFTDIGPKLAS